MSVRAIPAILAVVPALAAVAVSSGGGGVPLAEISGAHRDRCARSGLLRPVCPRLVPRAPDYGSSLYVEPTLDVFDLGRGAESPRRPERNRPPDMLHVVAVAGDIERFTPFRDPTGAAAAALRDGLMRHDRTRPVSFGRVRWGARSGTLYLAPPYGYGGQNGNHLVFAWRERGRQYALSLHAWEPLTGAAETLREMVERLPGVEASRRLAQLTAVRWLPLGRGGSSAMATIDVPGEIHAFDVRVVARARTELELWVDPPTEGRVPVLRSTRSRACGVRTPYRLCFVRFRAIGPLRAGRWRVMATKRSEQPARVRVDLLFRAR
jgi:hypothetical protein